MIGFGPSDGIPRHLPGRVAPLLVLLCLWPADGVAQPPSASEGGGQWEFAVAASEEALWLAGLRGGQSALVRRTATTPFDRGHTANGRVVSMTAVGKSAFVFFEQDQHRSFYRYDEKGHRQSDLPGRAIPVDMVGARGILYALVPSSMATALSAPGVPTTEPATAPAFDAGDAPLSVVKYDGDDWLPLTPCPDSVGPHASPRLRPRLCPAYGKLLLLWVADQANQVDRARLDLETGRWSVGKPIGVANLTAFWIPLLDGVPTLVTGTEQTPGGETISAYRLLGDWVGEEAPEPRPAELRFSPLLEGVALTRYADAFGFNQHLGVLGTDAAAVAYLRFARIGAESIEPTVRAEEELTRPAAAQRSQVSFQVATLVVMVVVLTGLFVFRRRSLANIVPLPPGYVLVFHVRRLGGWLVDFVPFAWAGALMSGIQWLDGLRELAAWGIGTSSESGHPPAEILMWWAASCTLHTLYMLVMELLTGRTVGKVLTGTRLVAETGTRPAFWQILVRNVLRLLELVPQFWILGLLVLLSRNRQRLGDIFARTLVVYRAGPPKPSADQLPQDDEHPPEPPSDPPPNSS